MLGTNLIRGGALHQCVAFLRLCLEDCMENGAQSLLTVRGTKGLGWS